MHSHRKVLLRRVSSIILYRDYETYGREDIDPKLPELFFWWKEKGVKLPLNLATESLAQGACHKGELARCGRNLRTNAGF